MIRVIQVLQEIQGLWEILALLGLQGQWEIRVILALWVTRVIQVTRAQRVTRVLLEMPVAPRVIQEIQVTLVA